MGLAAQQRQRHAGPGAAPGQCGPRQPKVGRYGLHHVDTAGSSTFEQLQRPPAEDGGGQRQGDEATIQRLGSLWHKLLAGGQQQGGGESFDCPSQLQGAAAADDSATHTW